MISRQWRGLARLDEAQNYVQHLLHETFPSLKGITGFVDASILSRPVAGGIEFLIVTRWDSLDAIAKFSGSDLEGAVVPAEVAAMMIEFDERVKHFDVVETS